ncbi:DLW-39 family protein [Actinomyces sp.]|nr:DLW-39 family protein [Actinomyces sp.]MDO4901426.1 DLW-39 family protein [Actinomyces sp.]
MKSRTLLLAAVFSCLGVLGYAAWLKLEAERAERAAWAEVTDPVA